MDNEFDGLGGSLLAAQDVLEAVLEKMDAAALCQIKAVSVAWCNNVRRELCNRLWVRLSRRERQPAPEGVDSITDLNVECLNEAGRPWEVVVAGRQLPQLARLHGWGFVVDVQKVREADLEEEEKEEEEDDEEEQEEEDQAESPLGGDTLRSCIQGEGQPPDELLLAAVACAASGTVRGIPVQRLREDDAIDELYLRASGIGVTGATLLGLMLPTATSVRSLDLENNELGPEGGAAIAEGLKGNSTLQSLNLNGNLLCGLWEHIEGDPQGVYTTLGITKLCEGLKGSAVTSLDLAENGLCCISSGINRDGDGITKLCEGLKGSAVTSLDLSWNDIGAKGCSALAAVLKKTQIAKLNLDNNCLCGITLVTGTYTAEGMTKLCEGLKGSAVTSLSLAGNELCGVNEYGVGVGTYTTEVITKLCEGLKGSAVTSLKLGDNCIGGYYDEDCKIFATTEGGIIALCEGLKGSAVTSLDLWGNSLTDEAKQELQDAAGNSVRIKF